MRTALTRSLSFAALLASACSTADPAGEDSTNTSYDTATLEVFNLQARIYCPTADPFCGHPDQASLIADYYVAVNEMNLEYIPTGISFHAMAPIITAEDRFSTMT